MTDDLHIDGQNEEMDFEREDLGAKPILIFLLALIIGCVLVALVLKGLYSYSIATRTTISRHKVRWYSRPPRRHSNC